MNVKGVGETIIPETEKRKIFRTAGLPYTNISAYRGFPRISAFSARLLLGVKDPLSHSPAESNSANQWGDT